MISKLKDSQHEDAKANYSVIIWNMAIGSAFAWEIAKLLGSKHPYLAPLSVILCQQTTFNRTVQLSLQRIVGTILGILLTVLIATHIQLNGWFLGLLLLLGAYCTKWLNLDIKVLHQVALTILFVFVFEEHSKSYALDRMKDTSIGIIIAIVLQFFSFRFINWKKSSA